MLQAHVLCQCIGAREGLVAFCDERAILAQGHDVQGDRRTWQRADERLLARVRANVGDERKAGGLSDASSGTCLPFAGIVRLVYANVICAFISTRLTKGIITTRHYGYDLSAMVGDRIPCHIPPIGTSWCLRPLRRGTGPAAPLLAVASQVVRLLRSPWTGNRHQRTSPCWARIRRPVKAKATNTGSEP